MRLAMMTVEVLVAMLILFITITTSSTVIKFLNQVKTKQSSYEDIYIAVLSIKDQHAHMSCDAPINGALNGFHYNITCQRVQKSKNYIHSGEADEPSGFIGPFTIALYDVKMTLKRDTFQHSYSYFYTTYKKSSQ